MKILYKLTDRFPRFIFSLVIIGGGFFLMAVDVFAQGNLLVTPMRVVFDEKKKMQELNLANTGKDTARYLISFIEIRMNPDGTFEKISEPDSGQNFASSFIRFFPRSVVLPPNEAQVVKLQLVNTSRLSPGEYRSHIYFRAEPDEKALGEEIETAMQDSSISIQLTPVFGLSMPVIIRQGEQTGKVSLSGLELITDSSGAGWLSMVFNRSGNTSVYGDIVVDHVSPKGKVTRIINVKGMAVYTPNSSRQMQIPLPVKPGIDYHSGKLVVAYGAAADDSNIPLTQAELVLK